MEPKELRSGIKAENIERLHQILSDLSDASGIVRGLSMWDLSITFNRRYRNATKPISDTAIRSYIDYGIAAGWLSLERENGIRGRLIFTLRSAEIRE